MRYTLEEVLQELDLLANKLDEDADEIATFLPDHEDTMTVRRQAAILRQAATWLRPGISKEG